MPEPIYNPVLRIQIVDETHISGRRLLVPPVGVMYRRQLMLNPRQGSDPAFSYMQHNIHWADSITRGYPGVSVCSDDVWEKFIERVGRTYHAEIPGQQVGSGQQTTNDGKIDAS